MIHRIFGALFGAALLSVAAIQPAAAQPPQPPRRPGRAAAARVAFTFPPVHPNGPMAPADHIAVHGKSLEGNLEGNTPDRAVEVILPPSYATRQTPPLSGDLPAPRLRAHGPVLRRLHPRARGRPGRGR